MSSITEPKYLLAVGGEYLREDTASAGLISCVNIATGKIKRLVRYRSPPNAYAQDTETPSILFKAASIKGNLLYACTTTELITYSLDDFSIVNYVSLPFFNDIHHVYPTKKGTLLVAVTGLDLVCELAPSGKLIRDWNVFSNESPWNRFSKQTDYRLIASTKPHLSHPNYTFEHNSQYWVTRCQQKDVISLSNRNNCLRLADNFVHDGVEYNSLHYFTSVDGHIIKADLSRLTVLDDIQLTDVDGRQSIGWCRGICVLDEFDIIVGYSRIRPTKWVENIQWAKNQIGIRSGSKFTRLVRYNLRTGLPVWQTNLESAGFVSIFSIHCI